MFKTIKRLFFLSFLAAAALIAYKISLTPQMVIPFPYKIELSSSTNLFEERSDTNPHIVILGDRMGKTLVHYLPPLTTLVSQGLRNPLVIQNWSQEGEGIHRSVEKLKRYAKEYDNLPSMIIFHGGSQEFYEKRFSLENREAILKNFEYYQNDALASAVILLPWLSRLIYHPMELVKLGPVIDKDENRYTSLQTQQRMELTFKFFDYHLQEMISLARQHDSTLIFITTPVNLEEPPRTICTNAHDQEKDQAHKQIEELLAEGRTKEAFSMAERLYEENIGNAMTAYLYGLTAKANNQISVAREALIQAAATDCETWRINPVFNSLKAHYAHKEDLFFIDFDRMLNQQLGQNVLFLNPIYPQHLFYQRLTQILAREIRTILQLPL